MGKKVFKAVSKIAAVANPVGIVGTDAAAKVGGVDNAPIISDASKQVHGGANKVTSRALSSLAPAAPPIEVPPVEAAPAEPEEDIEETAQKSVIRRRQASNKTRTLLSSGLGGGNATVGRPTLLGGG